MRKILIITSILIVNISFAQDLDVLNEKAKNAYDQGEYKKAVKYSEQVIGIIGAQIKRNKTEYIEAINNLAYAQMSLGYLKESADNFKLILKTYDKKDFKTVDYLEAVANVAKIYNAVSKPDSVEIFYNVGIKLFEEVSQKNSKYYRNNLFGFYTALVELKAINASLLNNKGYYQEAIDLLEVLVESIEETFPDQFKSLDFYATLLNNIGNYYMEIEDMGNAAKYFYQYKEIINEESRPADYLQSLTNMGTLYSNIGNADSAIYYWQKAIEWGDNKNLQTLTSYKSVLVNIGAELAYFELYDSALAYLEKSLEIQNSQTGYDAYLYKNTLFNLATTYNWRGDYKKSNEIWRDLLKRIKEEIRYNFSYLSDSEKRKFFQKQQFYYENFANYCFEASGIYPSLQYSDTLFQGLDLASDLYNNRIMTKGLLLNSTNKMRQRIINGKDENAKEKFSEWIEKRYQLITMLTQVNPDIDEINQLEKDIEKTEIELARISDPFRKGFVISEINWQDIQKRLKPGEVAIETIRILNGAGYLALILTSETVDHPHLAIILSAKNRFLEKERMSYYNNSIKFQMKDTLSYEIFWEPIMAAVKQVMTKGKNIEKIYFSPDGIYHQLNLNTLYNTKSKYYLIDELDVEMIESTKHLAIEGNSKQSDGEKSAVLVGNPTYTLNEKDATNYFPALPGTEIEINEIATQLKDDYWRVQVNKGIEATSASIKNINSPNIIHIATHGFFVDLDSETQDNSLIGLLLNSGLVLVGVNQNDSETREAGILRAFEATNLNLDETELVVLSACETGLGNYHPGEGVYGLQKAFFAAGAKHIIMSLWKVDDKATQQLMNYFYTEYLQNNDLQMAFKTAQLKLKEKYPDPKYWGAFVLLKG